MHIDHQFMGEHGIHFDSEQGILPVPLQSLGSTVPEDEAIAVKEQVNLLSKWLEAETGKAIASHTEPVVTSDLSHQHFPPSTTYILVGLKSAHDNASISDEAWVLKNAPGWQKILTEGVATQEDTEFYLQAVELSAPDSDEKFCNGMPMVMAMGGFQWSLGKLDTKPDCLNYFVPPWTLDDKGKFVGAMVYSFLLGMMTEAVTNFQIWLRPYLGTGRLRKFTLPLLYALQQWFGYIVMLITMMYSVEMFGALLLGLVLGRLLFLPRSASKPIIRTSSRPVDNGTSVTLSAIPETEETPLADRSSIRRRRS